MRPMRRNRQFGRPWVPGAIFVGLGLQPCTREDGAEVECRGSLSESLLLPVRGGAMTSLAVRNFMKQQGFAEEPEHVCEMHFAGLYFQPRIVGSLVLVAIIS